ncbi:MAG TPA: Mov34/MPN/PAD-1 family protein [Candidatus Acidoferrales bacterium]
MKSNHSYQISPGELRRLRTLAERKQKSGHKEVCGVILSQDGFQLELIHLRNQTLQPGQFLIKQDVYQSVKDRAKKRGRRVLGIFHSHPIGEAIPGPGDIKSATSGSLMLIYDVCGREAKLWKIRKLRGHRRAAELVLDTSEEAVAKLPRAADK